MNMYDEMMSMGGEDLMIVLSRDIEVQDLDMTFSAEAMDNMGMQLLTFIGTRMMRYRKQTGLMPQNLRITLTVETSA